MLPTIGSPIMCRAASLLGTVVYQASPNMARI